MKRAELVSTLSSVYPALSTMDCVPAFSCFCFSEGVVTAYNDVVAMQATLDLDLELGARGPVLLNFLRNSVAKEVTIEEFGDTLKVKAGRAVLKLPTIPTSDFIYERPKEEPLAELESPEGLVECFEKCSVSIGMDPAKPHLMGVTMRFVSGGIILFSTNNRTASRAVCAVELHEDLIGTSVVCPPSFCQLFTSIAAEDYMDVIRVHEDWIEVEFESGLILFSRTIEVGKKAKVGDYNVVFEPALQVESNDMVSIPKGFERCLDRAMVVLAPSKKETSKFTMDDNRLRFHTDTEFGDIRDSVKIAEKHEDISRFFVPEEVKKVLPYICAMQITKTMMILVGVDFTHIIAVRGG